MTQLLDQELETVKMLTHFRLLWFKVVLLDKTSRG